MHKSLDLIWLRRSNLKSMRRAPHRIFILAHAAGASRAALSHGRLVEVEIVSVRSVRISFLAIAFILEGCTIPFHNGTGNDPLVWRRADCQRGEETPELQKQFDDAKAVCLAQGETEDMVSGSTGSPCMTKQGYILRTKTEHETACRGARPPA
jgi:hypothetical protein